MTFPKFLKYSQGIITLETLAYDRVPLPPFADQAGAMKFQQSISQRLKDLWDLMFPYTKKHYSELEEQALKFKEHMKMWRSKG